jgi:hypothetical protein
MTTLKLCTICKKEKLLNEFNKKGTSKDGLQPACKTCNAERSRAYYQRNLIEHRKVVTIRKKKNLAANKKRLVEFLSKHPCVDCGETDVRVLEFDHMVQADKKSNVSDMLRAGCSWKSILKEIEKCEVVCANHHRIRTYTKLGSYRMAPS